MMKIIGRKKHLLLLVLIFFLGVRKKIKSLHHHTLFFDEDLNQHSKEIYKNPTMANKAIVLCVLPFKIG